MNPLPVGVISIQGDVSEHREALKNAARDAGMSISVVDVRSADALDRVEGLVIPGGESTTISKLLRRWGLHDAIVERVRLNALPVMGTCAGCILLGSRGSGGMAEKGVGQMGLVDMGVDRNAYGRQVDSFESAVMPEPGKFGPVGGHGDDPLPLVFIRAPTIIDIGEGVEVLVRYEDRPVMVRQNNILALTFHPELSGDTRVHSLFLTICRNRLVQAAREGP